jgi:hypothetical protein
LALSLLLLLWLLLLLLLLLLWPLVLRGCRRSLLSVPPPSLLSPAPPPPPPPKPPSPSAKGAAAWLVLSFRRLFSRCARSAMISPCVRTCFASRRGTNAEKESRGVKGGGGTGVSFGRLVFLVVFFRVWLRRFASVERQSSRTWLRWQ